MRGEKTAILPADLQSSVECIVIAVGVSVEVSICVDHKRYARLNFKMLLKKLESTV